jgi:hypothetical protein
MCWHSRGCSGISGAVEDNWRLLASGEAYAETGQVRSANSPTLLLTMINQIHMTPHKSTDLS